MRLAVVGGKLQGTEAAYLAGEAGYDVVLIDRRPGRPAAGLTAESHVFDVTSDPVRLRELLLTCDACLPACEDDRTLAYLAAFVPGLGVPFLFDSDAYQLTSSKLRSNELFARLDVPRPSAWPSCPFPVVVKPSVGSGSTGVRLAWSEPELALARAQLASLGVDVVAEEYVPGPSLSVDMVSFDGETATLAPTWLEFDTQFDCKRVVTPVEQAAIDPASQGGGSDLVTAATLAALDESSRRLAEGVGRTDARGVAGLHGVMDVEVMIGPGGTPKVIEIDARLPSQTPACAFHASDVNIVQLLAETFAAGRIPSALTHGRAATAAKRGAVYEHVLVADGRVQVLGEHIVGAAEPLTRCDGLWGADVVLTDGPDAEAPIVNRDRWVAVIMTKGETAAEARERAAAAVARLADQHGLDIVLE
jgi:pyrrolysine biosynthesis protein PylC